jgi:16S rRNA (cytosine967-C5)-methyltransferase
MATSSLLSIAANVVGRANRERPADGVLRDELRRQRGISRDDGRFVSESVFAFYRWYGWLNRQEPIEQQLRQARKLNRAFQLDSQSVPDGELTKAVPDWTKDHVEVSPSWLRALQLEPKLWLRARPGQGRQLAEKLGECWVAGDGLLADTLRYDGSEDLFRTREFQSGEFELQDVSSQMVGLVCNPQPGETWWDACAGEGGKLLHLGDLMRNKGLIWASDRAEWRLKKLKLRAARARLFNYRATLWDGGTKLPTKTKFDGILVDAPCSGIGTWQRNPHARWTATPEDVRELGEIQKRLLANTVPALKPGGRLVYSVCTLARAETTEVAEAITKQFPELKVQPLSNPLTAEKESGQIWFWPQEMEGNGMFICAWQKQSS